MLCPAARLSGSDACMPTTIARTAGSAASLLTTRSNQPICSASNCSGVALSSVTKSTPFWI